MLGKVSSFKGLRNGMEGRVNNMIWNWSSLNGR